MPKTKLRNLTFTQRQLISAVNSALQEIDFGQAVYDLAVGADAFDPLVERIRAHYSNTGLSFVVGNTTMALVNVGKTMFLNVGGTNVFGSDGVNFYKIVNGQTYLEKTYYDGTDTYNTIAGVNRALGTFDRLTAAFGNAVGLSFVIGSTTLAITTVGKTVFLNVGGTNIIGHDGVDMYITLGGSDYKFAAAAGATFGID